MYERERRTAVEAVLEACRFCRTVQGDLVSSETMIKRDRSPVTVADYGSQAIINRALAREFPADPMLAEEDAAALDDTLRQQLFKRLPGMTSTEILSAVQYGSTGYAGARRWWTLDPVDGTKGFLRQGQYAVALALIEEGEVVLGLLGCPNVGPDGTLFIAVRGEGTRARSLGDPAERTVRVSEQGDPSRAVLVESVEAEHSNHRWSAQVTRRLGMSGDPVRYDSQVKYGIVARGEASLYLRLSMRPGYEEKVWDHAAGCIVVTEAGGRVTDVDGRPVDFSAGVNFGRQRGVVATNGRIHEAVLEAVRGVIESP